MANMQNRNIVTKGNVVSTPTISSVIGRKKLVLKDRKYGKQVSKLTRGQKVTALSSSERQGIYDTLKSLNLNTNFQTSSIGNGSFLITRKK